MPPSPSSDPSAVPSQHPPSSMSQATKEMLARVRRMIPPMLEKFHKGQLGRVGVIGGSEDYTGAPYFSAMASARLGCDMSHVICTPAAATVIKSYSPNLMVHPLMRSLPSTPSSSKEDTALAVADRIIPLLSRLHVLVVGPGLGRDPLMQDTCALVIAAARARGLPLVLDADALLLVQRDPSLVHSYPLAILTPNVVEFARLAGALGLSEEGKGGEVSVGRLASVLGGVVVVQKGQADRVSDGKTTLVVDVEGGRKRSGGQGDTLTGSIATFLGWRKAYLDGLWDTTGTAAGDAGGEGRLREEELVALAAFGGSAVTRECSRLAFAKRGRSLQASDLTEEVHAAFLNLFGEVDDHHESSHHEHDSSGSRL